MQAPSPSVCVKLQSVPLSVQLLDVGIAHVYFAFHLGGGFEIHPVCPSRRGNSL